MPDLCSDARTTQTDPGQRFHPAHDDLHLTQDMTANLDENEY
ncbi:hypothetical protein [Psychromonas sp. MB-3u-54]|nr:hypothetical protein [Psychromonas sp. MB-3u-54]